MGTSIQEKLSAYADDELGDFETRRLTDEVLKSEAARKRLAHYQVIGAALRDEPAQAFEPSFTEGVMAKVDALPDLHVEPGKGVSATQHKWKHARASWVKILAGGAIAASVALISLFTLKSIDSQMAPATVATQQVFAPEPAIMDTVTNPPSTPALAQTAPPRDLAKTVSTSATTIPEIEPIPPVLDHSANERLLGGYLATHAEHAAHRSVLPHARMMGFDIPADK